MSIPAKHGDFNGIEIIEQDGSLLTSSLGVADRFEKRHANVLRDISELDCSPDFLKLNFEFSTYRPEGGKRDYPYVLMTRDGFTFLAMGFTGKEAAQWKEKYITAFNAMEGQLRAPAVLSGPQLMAAALIEADATMKVQAEKIESMQEDVAAHERLIKADGSLNTTAAAKSLGMRPKELFNWLSHNGWFYKRAGAGSWLGYQDKCNRGLLEHKTTTVLRADGSEKVTEQVRITAKGLSVLAKLIFPTAKLID